MSRFVAAVTAGFAGAAIGYYFLFRRKREAVFVMDREAVYRAYEGVAEGTQSCCVTAVKDKGGAMGYSADRRGIGGRPRPGLRKPGFARCLA